MVTRIAGFKQQLCEKELESQGYEFPVPSTSKSPGPSIRDIPAQRTALSRSQTSSVDSDTRKFPKKRPVPTASNEPPVSILDLFPPRPSSAASSSRGSVLQLQPQSQPQPSQLPNGRATTDISIPNANVIEPSLLLSFLTEPEDTRHSILFLDVRPKEAYERGYINADNVVWIDPILLDQE